jgi:hypothetical protein
MLGLPERHPHPPDTPRRPVKRDGAGFGLLGGPGRREAALGQAQGPASAARSAVFLVGRLSRPRPQRVVSSEELSRGLEGAKALSPEFSVGLGSRADNKPRGRRRQGPNTTRTCNPQPPTRSALLAFPIKRPLREDAQTVERRTPCGPRHLIRRNK